MEQLKPCPFCGEEVQLFEGDKKQEKAYIQCDECGLSVHDKWASPETLIKQWNTRAERTCHVENLGGINDSVPLLLCKSCFEVNYAQADCSTWNYCPNCGAKIEE